MNLGEKYTDCTLFYFFKEVNLLKAKDQSSCAGQGPEWGCPKIVLFYHLFFFLRFKHFHSKEFWGTKEND